MIRIHFVLLHMAIEFVQKSYFIHSLFVGISSLFKETLLMLRKNDKWKTSTYTYEFLYGLNARQTVEGISPYEQITEE